MGKVTLLDDVASFAGRPQPLRIGSGEADWDTELTVIDPSMISPRAKVPSGGARAIDHTVEPVAFEERSWGGVSARDRGRVLWKLAVLGFSEEKNAPERGNDTVFGLAAGFWSQSATKVRRVADRLKAGTNCADCGGETDAASSFGGMKRSGYGRDMGTDTIDHYSKIKCVWVA